jgi:hypothetical protein
MFNVNFNMLYFLKRLIFLYFAIILTYITFYVMIYYHKHLVVYTLKIEIIMLKEAKHATNYQINKIIYLLSPNKLFSE